VTVPEATMHKDYLLSTWKNDIRITGQITAMQTETEAVRMEKLAHNQFWLRVHLFNSRHALRKAERHTSLFPIRSSHHSEFGLSADSCTPIKSAPAASQNVHGASQDTVCDSLRLHPTTSTEPHFGASLVRRGRRMKIFPVTTCQSHSGFGRVY
jgi:hypothetical protein